jgi:glucose-6-phosphate 1-dehydrogenase
MQLHSTLQWKVFTPLLHAIEKEKIKPQKYGYGTRGPADADAMLASKGNYTRYDSPDEGFVWPTQPPRASTSTK